jgi:GWxTD domain-containing protein
MFRYNGFVLNFVVILALVIFGTDGFTQLPEFNFTEESGDPNFYYDLATFAGPDSNKSQLNVYTKIAYDELQFIQEDNHYRAQYELSITIFDKNDNPIDGKILKIDIIVDSYKKTNSRTDFSKQLVQFIILPDHYNIYIKIFDLDSKKSKITKTSIEIPDYFISSINVSSIILADSVIIDSSGHLKPMVNVMGSFRDNQDTIYVLFEIYNRAQKDSIKIVYNILNLDKELLLHHEYYKILDSTSIDELLKIFRNELVNGKYKLELKIGEEDLLVKRYKNFTIYWVGVPTVISDFDKAIEQLHYIAKRKEIKKMKKAEGEEKLRLFKEFWDSKDSTPETEENALMEEYYRRVEIANVNFGTHLDGWKSDRGMVYILLGPPNDIERHPFEAASRPYEIWFYYPLNREFIFVDRTGFGDYRLVTPYSDIYESIR